MWLSKQHVWKILKSTRKHSQPVPSISEGDNVNNICQGADDSIVAQRNIIELETEAEIENNTELSLNRPAGARKMIENKNMFQH